MVQARAQISRATFTLFIFAIDTRAAVAWRYMTSEPWTDAKLRSAESPRSSSYMRRPAATLPSPAQP
jgi:hypothetical protein